MKTLPADPGHESDLQNQENHRKKWFKKRQKCDFSKIHILLHSGEKCDILPEIGPSTQFDHIF